MKHAEKIFPWYDSPWLTVYLIAKEHIRDRHPQKLDEFVRAFDVFRTSPDFEVAKIPRLFDDAVHQELKDLVAGLEHRDADKDELMTFGRFVKWNLPRLTALQEDITEQVSDVVGEPVEPCYNFLSLYKELGVCQVHMDAPFAKWTVDYCIEQSATWPIYFSQIVPWPEDWEAPKGDWQDAIKHDPANHFEPQSMQEGEAVIFSGSSQWHYRDAIERSRDQNFCHLLFFHYIPEGTAELKVPANWKTIFDIPELGELENPTGETIFDL